MNQNTLTCFISDLLLFLDKIETKIIIVLKIDVFSEFQFKLGRFDTFINFTTSIERNQDIEYVQLKDYEYDDIANLNETLHDFCFNNKINYSNILSNYKNQQSVEFYHKNYSNSFKSTNKIFPIIVEDLKLNQHKIFDFFLPTEISDFTESEEKFISKKFTFLFCISYENFEKFSTVLQAFKEINLEEETTKNIRFVLLLISELKVNEIDKYRGHNLNELKDNVVSSYKEKCCIEDFMNLFKSYEVTEKNCKMHEDSYTSYLKIKENYDYIKKNIPEKFEILFCDRRHYINEKYFHYDEGKCYLISENSFLIKKYDLFFSDKSEASVKLRKLLQNYNRINPKEKYTNITKNKLENYLHQYLDTIELMEFDTQSKFRNEKSFIKLGFKSKIKLNKAIKEFLIPKIFPLHLSYFVERKFKSIVDEIEIKLKFLKSKKLGNILNNKEEEKNNALKQLKERNNIIIDENQKFIAEIHKRKIICGENGLISKYYLYIYTEKNITKHHINFNGSNYLFSKIKVLPLTNLIKNKNDAFKCSGITKSIKLIESETVKFTVETNLINYTGFKMTIDEYILYTNYNNEKSTEINIDYLFLPDEELTKFKEYITNLQFKLMKKNFFSIYEKEFVIVKNIKFICEFCAKSLINKSTFFYCGLNCIFYCEKCIYNEISMKKVKLHSLLYILTDNSFKNDLLFKITNIKLNMLEKINSSHLYPKNILMKSFCNFCQKEIFDERFVLLNEVDGFQGLFSDFCLVCIFNKKIQAKILKEFESQKDILNKKPAVFLRVINTDFYFQYYN